MPDAKDFAPNNPVYQKESPQPKYKNLSFKSFMTDGRDIQFPYSFEGDYFETDEIQFVKAYVTFLRFSGKEISDLTYRELCQLTADHDPHLTQQDILETLRFDLDSMKLGGRVVLDCSVEVVYQWHPINK